MLLVNVLHVLLDKLEILVVLLLADDIQPFLKFLQQEIAQKYLDSLDVDVRNVGVVVALSGRG